MRRVLVLAPIREARYHGALGNGELDFARLVGLGAARVSVASARPWWREVFGAMSSDYRVPPASCPLATQGRLEFLREPDRREEVLAAEQLRAMAALVLHGERKERDEQAHD